MSNIEYNDITYAQFKEQILSKNFVFNKVNFSQNFYKDITTDKPDFIDIRDLLFPLVKDFKNNLRDIKIKLIFDDCIFDTIVNFDFEDLENVSLLRINKCDFKHPSYFKFLDIDTRTRTEGSLYEKIYCFFNKVNFDKVFFENVNFKTSTIFKDTLFNDNTYFTQCTFEKAVYAEDLPFKRNVFVKGCVFKGKTNFSNICENDLIITDFNKEPFGESKIYRTVFENTCQLFGEFKGGITISGTDFMSDFEFRPTYMSQKSIILENLIFQTQAYFRNLVLGSNIHFRNIDLSKVSFLYSKFDEAQFSECTFSENKMYDELQLRLEDSSINPNDVIKELRMFEMSFDKRKDFEQAGKFHCDALQLQRETDTSWIKKLILLIYKCLSNYGESVERSLFWIGFVIIFFSLLYVFTGLQTPDGKIWWWDCSKRWFLGDWGYGLLYSLISSVPFKREGDLVKTLGSWTTTFSIIQTIVQTILGSLFLIALRRKFKR